jgi:hypothetical protein
MRVLIMVSAGGWPVNARRAKSRHPDGWSPLTAGPSRSAGVTTGATLTPANAATGTQISHSSISGNHGQPGLITMHSGGYVPGCYQSAMLRGQLRDQAFSTASSRHQPRAPLAVRGAMGWPTPIRGPGGFEH